MRWFIFGVAVLIISILIGLIFPIDPTQYSPDTFPDEKFTTTFKKYNTKQIADALDEIGNGI